MLEKVTIQNYRCLRSVSVSLKPLTVLVGPNDSGKSAFLRALQYLAGAGNLEKYDWWRNDQSNRIVVEGRTREKQIRRDSEEGRLQIKPGGPNPISPTGLFQLPSDGVPMQSSGHVDEGQPPVIQPNGMGIAALVDHLLRRDRKRFDGFVDTMRKLIDGLEEIEIATPQPELRRIDLVVDGGLHIPADKTSVGVRLLLFFVALSYNPAPPKLILLEEPENGVHPKRLGDVMRLLRQITEGTHGGYAAQVVLTTHSPHLLDYIDLDRDRVVVFSRAEDGSRNAEPADAERLKNFLDEFMLGEVWYNEGEAGLVRRDK